MKVIKPLENREIAIKGTIRKIASQEGVFINFLGPVMTAGLPFMKNIPTPPAQNVLIPFGLSKAMLAKENLWIRYKSNSNFK